MNNKYLLSQGFINPPYKKTLLEQARENSITNGKTELFNNEQRSASDGSTVLNERSTPITNRGVSGNITVPDVTDFNWLNAFDSLESKQVKVKGNKAVIVTTPLPDKDFIGNYSFIDYINFSFHVSDLDYQGVSDDDVICSLSPILDNIFGFGVTGKRENGLNFYKTSYDLGVNGWGTVCIGGQRDTVLVTVKGQGLMASKRSWAKNLYSFFLKHTSSKITRIDIAHDSFDSKKSVDDYRQMFRAGLFTNRGQTPKFETLGDWENIDNSGRTIYIGKRTSGKLLRIYEKGLQLGRGFTEVYKNWVRTELELRNDQRIIPIDVLKNPGQYLAGAYPALKKLSVVQKVPETIKKSIQTTIVSSIEIAKNQFGKYIWVFSELYGLDRAFKMLTEGKEEPPNRLDLQNYESFDSNLNISPSRAITLQEVII